MTTDPAALPPPLEEAVTAVLRPWDFESRDAPHQPQVLAFAALARQLAQAVREGQLAIAEVRGLLDNVETTTGRVGQVLVKLGDGSDFFENDQPVAQITAAFARGPQHLTAPPREEVVERYWPYDGPHSRDSVATAAAALGALVRYLNNATQAGTAPVTLPYPASAHQVIADLATTVARLPQLLEQLQAVMRAQAADPRLYDDRRDRPGSLTADAVTALLTMGRTSSQRFWDDLTAAAELSAHLGYEIGEAVGGDAAPSESRICIDESCPACGWPERWFALDRQVFGCPKCDHESQERTR